MKKIGLIINRYLQGPSVLAKFNDDGSWSRKAVDIRDVLKLYDVNSGGSFCVFMSFSDNGTYITVVYPYVRGEGRAGDNVAAWLFIPNGIDVNGQDIVDLIEAVKKQISSPIIDHALLEDLLSKEYTESVAVPYKPSSGEECAYIKCGLYPMDKLMGEYRYQPNYSNYKYVLIELPKPDGMTVIPVDLKNLTYDKPIKLVVVWPPKNLPEGVTVQCKGRNFDTPQRFAEGEKLSITFQKRNRLHIDHLVSVEYDGQICDTPKQFDWKVGVRRSNFTVKADGENAKTVTEKVCITINGQKLPLEAPIYLPEQEALNAKICVSLSGYKSLEKGVNLIAGIQGGIQVTLQGEDIEKSWKVRLLNGEQAELTLKGRALRFYQQICPLPGYEISRNGFVQPKKSMEGTSESIKALFIGFAIGLTLAVCGFLIYNTFFSKSSDTGGHTNITNTNLGKNSRTDQESDSQNSKDKRNADNNEDAYRDAINYLETNLKEGGEINKHAMDTIEGLHGFFEEIRTYDINSIKARVYLQKSDAFKSFCTRVEDLGIDRKAGKNFVDQTDPRITISTYYTRISSDRDMQDTLEVDDGEPDNVEEAF